MSSQPSTSRCRTALYWGSALLCLFAASYLTTTPRYGEILKRPLNPLALYSSPYGMVLSTLLQQPVNEEWHKGIEMVGAKPEADHDHDHDHDHKGHEEEKHEEHHGHQHAAGEHCDICDAAAGRFGSRDNGSLLSGLALKLQELARTHLARTNPKPISPAHQLYIAQNIEKKLLVAYNLDPTNYAAYDTYFLFLTENVVAGLGSPEKVRQAQLITQRTLELSRREQVSPLPALTAALATFNRFMLHLSLGNPKDDNFNRMLAAGVSEELQKYERLRAVAISNGNWDLAPEAWRLQADERANFIQAVAKKLVDKPPGKTAK